MKAASKTIIITGGNSGLGYECARNIANESKDYHVLIACRNLQKASKAIQAIMVETGNPNISAMELDLSSLASVRNF